MATEIGAPQGIRARKRRGVVELGGGTGVAPALGHAVGDQAHGHVQHHVGRGGIGAHADPHPLCLQRGEGAQDGAVPPGDQRAMRDRHPVRGIARKVVLRRHGGMGRDETRREETEPLQPGGRRHAMQAADRFQLHRALRHVQADRHVQRLRPGEGLAQQRFGAGLHPVGREHAGNEAAVAAVNALGEGGGLRQPGQPARLIEHRLFDEHHRMVRRQPGKQVLRTLKDEVPTEVQEDNQVHWACPCG